MPPLAKYHGTQTVITAENARAVVDLLAFIESRFAVGAVPRLASISPTGEPYDVLAAGFFQTIAQACDNARSAFEEYALSRSGILYWRISPEFEEEKRGWCYYMRLLISNKPVIQSTELETPING